MFRIHESSPDLESLVLTEFKNNYFTKISGTKKIHGPNSHKKITITNIWCVLSLIAQTKFFCPRFPILLLHSSHLSCTRRKPHLVGGGVHPAVCGERPKNHDFSKISGDVPLWKIIYRDLLSRFGREYACWKGHKVYFKVKLWNLEFTVFFRFWDIMNVR